MKNFLQKSLLFMALFLGSCTVVYTPNSTLVDLIGGKSGTFTYLSIDYGFTITSDAYAYIETKDGFNKPQILINLPYSSGSDDSAIYEGVVSFLEDGKISNYTVKITLSSLTSTGGKYTATLNGLSFITAVEFTWDSSESSHVSIFETISQ